MRRRLALAAAVAATSVVATTLAPPPPATAAAAEPAACRTAWTDYDRPAEHQVIEEHDLLIPMSDGVNLRADVYRPDVPDGTQVPVIVTITPYGKTAIGPETWFVERGYAQVVVEVRGTGTSEGTWHAFDEREQLDGLEVLAWAKDQPWSDGRLAMYGASYLAITQLFTAAQHPPGLQAIFPIVPEADAYRDIVFVGGQTNVAFIPMWLGLVTGIGLLPGSAAATDPVGSARIIAEHLTSIPDYQVDTVVNAIGGGDITYDGEFWRVRSPIEVVDDIEVPAFVVGGLHDLFQRGEPLVYEALRAAGNETKLLMGPWGHLDGSSGAGLPADGVPNLHSIALRWFDQYVRGVDTDAECLPDVTQWLLGEGHYEVQPGWPHPDLHPRVQYLQPGGGLAATPPAEDGGADTLPQQPVNGVCSRSTNQWLMGVLGGTPCAEDNRLTELGEVTFTTEPLAGDLRLTGPIAARIWLSTTAEEAVVTVRVTDVAPDGRSTELSTGLLAASHRAVDTSLSRTVDDVVLQPWHPFSKEAVQPVTPGEPMPLDVEIFPTNAVLKSGHRLRVAVGPSDFPHAASPLPAAVAQAGGVLTIHHDAAHPSSVALPTVGPVPAPVAAAPVPAADPAAAPAAEPTGGTGTAGTAPSGDLPRTGGDAPALAGAVLLAAALVVRAARRRSAG